MLISVGSCGGAQAQFRLLGGEAGIRRQFYDDQMAGYDRSQTIWPFAYLGMSVLLSLAMVRSAIGLRGEQQEYKKAKAAKTELLSHRRHRQP
jgi:hypothetical protein